MIIFIFSLGLICSAAVASFGSSVENAVSYFTHKFHRAAYVPGMSMEAKYLHPEVSHQLHTLVFAVKLRNMDKLEQFVHEVSDPHHKLYGHHMTRDEVAKLTVDPQAVDTIKEYLRSQGVTSLQESTFGDFLTVEAPVQVWNQMFRTTLHRCHVKNRFTEEASTFIRAKEYSLPLELVNLVDEVFNLVQLPPAVQKHQYILPKDEQRDVGLEADDYTGLVTPDVINSVYNVSNNTGSAMLQQSVYESLNQSASPSDLTLFQAEFSLPIEPIAEDIGGHVFDGACETSYGLNGCGEANLDVQYIMGIAQHVPTVYYYWGGEDWMLDWITTVAEMTNPPAVFSISYGSYENEYDSSYLVAFNQQAIILAAVGTTIFASSGDDGVAGYYARSMPALCGYYPQFPASSPMVTAVGGSNGPQQGRPEVVCQANENGAIITSGGGFSAVYARPSWQDAVIAQYFSTVSGTSRAPATGYVSSGRGYPDVTLLAHDYVIFAGGDSTEVDGTSASSPVMAAFASLVNSYRVSRGSGKLGWLNPTLYEYYSRFINDITAGNNNCTAGRPPVCCTQGYYAVEGWDPATGLGSVNFGLFLSTLGDMNATQLDNTDYDDALDILSNGDNNDDTMFTSGAIAGVVIGGVIALAVIATCVYVFCLRKPDPAEPLLRNTV